MARIYCPQCAHQLSDQSVTCPNCGMPIAQPPPQLQQQQNLPTPQSPTAWLSGNQNNTIYTVIGLGICALFFVALLVTCNADNQPQDTTPPAAASHPNPPLTNGQGTLIPLS